MSALGDALALKDKQATLASRIEIVVDSDPETAAAITFSLRLEAPSFSEVLLSDQTAEQIAAAVTEYTAWATALW